MYGWMGTILRVDLSSGNIEKEPLSEELRRNYLGGRGINARILWDEVKPGTDGFAPENRLVFGNGPLTGTMVAAGRLNISAMSPLTQILGDSNAGSHFSPEMKYAGYDHIVFTGKADKPVYLWIDDDKVELRDAQHLWGKLTDETQHMIKDEVGDPGIQIVCIGPAGENLVRIAAVIVGTDGVCGRCGLGAVMGSKNLKGVAVRGTKGVKVPDPDAFRALVLNLQQRIMRSPEYQLFSTYGTTLRFTGRNKAGGLSMRNAQVSGQFPGFEEIRDKTLHEKYVIRDKACFGCAIHCRSWFEIKDGPYAGLKGVGIELACQEAWGSNLDNSYAPALYQAFTLCNQYGLDQTETGQVIAAATEWHEKGIITKQDLDGIELGWGNHEAFIAMIPRIANREGIGDLLAEDALRTARRLGKGAEKCITHSKGILKTNVEIRHMPTYAFGHAVSTRGADHLRGGSIPGTTKPGEYERVARETYENNFVTTLDDALEVCKFNTSHSRQELKIKELAELFSAATGIKVDEGEMRVIADRIWTLERAFIVREGITRKDDVLVGRFMDEPIHGGPHDGVAFSRQKWDKMLDDYYDQAGWDKKTGIPTRAKLEEVGLRDVADELEAMGKLGN